MLPAVGRWQRYWFADGGRTALAIVRVAVAAAVLLSLFKLAGAQSPVAASVYRPVGLWMLAGHHAPPAELVSLLWIVAWTSTAAMALGLATRASTALSFVTAVALVSLSFSASRTWSHQYNVVFLAQLALLGARSGDTLSLDWLVRTRVRKLPPRDEPRAYQWSLRLVQLAVVLMFAGAAFHKLLHGHFTLRWALSDNLRHHLLVRYDLAGNARPPVVDWLLAEAWRYQGAALLNMITQAAPLVAVLFIQRPLVRALAGLLFVIEVIMLGVVVGLWNLHWLPLVAVFVDWERLLARVRGRRDSHPPAPAGWRPPRAPSVFIALFVVYDVLTGFVPTLDHRLNTYPFSGFPMFATIRAREPYDEHQPYSVVSGSYEAFTELPLDHRTQRWIDHAHRNVHVVRDPDELERRLRDVLARARHYYPDWNIRGIRLWITVYEAPAHPAPARFERERIAILGEIAEDDTFRTLLGKLDPHPEHGHVELRPRGVDVGADTQLVYYRDDRPEPHPIPGALAGTRFDLGYQSLPGNPRYFVALVGDTPWLVASDARWRW
jgi:hypothetical protein